MAQATEKSPLARECLKILVAGAAGFLGSNLVDHLLEKGHEVIGLDSFQTGSPRNLRHLENHPRFRLIDCNIRTWLPDVSNIDQIYHLACPASPIQYQKDPIGTLGTCYEGTENLLKLARVHNARILFSSTSEVYGDPHVSPQPETYWGNVNPFGPRSCYDEGKRVAEALCFAYRQRFDVDVRLARIFNTYGPRMGGSDGRVVSTFIAAALAGDELGITGDGTATRSFQYVTDCVRGLCELMDGDYAPGPVNIGNDREFTILELAQMIAELVSRANGHPRAKIVFKPRPEDDPTRRRPQISLAKEALGWSPVVPLKEGLVRTIRWHIDEAKQAKI